MTNFDMATWAWPQWTMLSIYAFNLVLYAALDGKPRSGEYRFGMAAVSAAIGLFIMWSGGFFA